MKRKKIGILLVFSIILLMGCDTAPKNAVINREKKQQEEKKIAECYRDIYEQAKSTDTLETLETVKNIVRRMGEEGYTAVDMNNQIDMVNADKLMRFVNAVDNHKKAEQTLINVGTKGDFTRFALSTSNGHVSITESYICWDENTPEIKSKKDYKAHTWKYTKEGYLFLEEYQMAGYDGPSGHTAVRVQPLDEKCRELNRKYILPVGYGLNNIFSVDWSESDFGKLDFYDIFDLLYPQVYGRPSAYLPDDNLGVGAIYHIPKDEFETVIGYRFNIASETLQAKTEYLEEEECYEYRPRGLYEREPPNYPFPEVTDYTENEDGTMTLSVRVVYPEYNLPQAYVHEVVVHPLTAESFRYVSNDIIGSQNKFQELWRMERLTKERWKEYYGENP